MRLAYMVTSLGIGGAEHQVVALAERMVSRGHDVMLIVLRSAVEHEWQTAVPIVRLNASKSLVGAIGGLRQSAAALRDFQPDILHSHTFHANITARAMRATGAAPIVLSTIHNVYEGGRQRMLAYRLTDRFSAHTTAVSQAVADRYSNSGAVPNCKCSVITNGIDLEEFSPSRIANSPHAQQGFVWLAAGRDVPAKDFDTLLSAFKRVRREISDARLFIAGDRAPERTDTDGVCWLGLCRDMPSRIAACDAFILSSAWEGMPLVVGEAMAMEKPVVATDVGGVRELVGDCGLIVEARNPEGLAHAMLRMMSAPKSQRRAMGVAARERIRTSFDIDSKVDEWESLYLSLHP